MGALFFECLTDGVYPIGIVVEVMEIGPAETEDDDEGLREPFAWATNGNEDAGWWYFRSRDLRPLTADARAAHAILIDLEKRHPLRGSYPRRPLPF